jgi:hypothetical protein
MMLARLASASVLAALAVAVPVAHETTQVSYQLRYVPRFLLGSSWALP